MSRRRSLATALLLTLALAAPAGADTVTTVPDAAGKLRKLQGTVSSETPTEVVIGANKVPVEEVESIEYTGSPPNFTIADRAEKGGDLAKAADEYAKAANLAAEKPFIAQTAQFNRLRLLAATTPAEAISGLDAFTRANPRSRHLGPALELEIRLLLEKGDPKEYARADGLATKLREVAWAKDHADVTKARILTKQGKPAEAVAALGKLADAKADTPRGREARLALAEALAAQKKYPEAEAAARAVIQAAGPEDAAAQAAAHNTLGDVFRAAGKPKEALFEYLHTDLLFARNKEEHARALFQIIKLSRELKREDRAIDALDRLKQEYPTSPYLAAAGGGK